MKTPANADFPKPGAEGAVLPVTGFLSSKTLVVQDKLRLGFQAPGSVFGVLGIFFLAGAMANEGILRSLACLIVENFAVNEQTVRRCFEGCVSPVW